MNDRSNDPTRWATTPVEDIVTELAETTGGQRETWKWILYCSTMNRKRVEAEEKLEAERGNRQAHPSVYEMTCDSLCKMIWGTTDKYNNIELVEKVLELKTNSDAWMALRPEVRAFAQLMEFELLENDHKSGWKQDQPYTLLDRLREELVELEGALGTTRPKNLLPAQVKNIAKEAADVANFAMMITDVCRGLEGPTHLAKVIADVRKLMRYCPACERDVVVDEGGHCKCGHGTTVRKG